MKNKAYVTRIILNKHQTVNILYELELIKEHMDYLNKEIKKVRGQIAAVIDRPRRGYFRAWISDAVIGDPQALKSQTTLGNYW